MPSDIYQLDTHRLLVTGVDLNSPVDAVKQTKLPILENVRSYILGGIQPRPGLTSTITGIAGKSPAHSIRRLNDDSASDYTYVAGVQDRLGYGKVALANADGPYSGNPLALVSARPTQSPAPWMYVSDSSRMRKIKVDGTVHQIGLPAPANAPTLALGVPKYKVIDEFAYVSNATLQAVWAQAGTAALPTLATRVNTTVVAILYDSGNTGWACVNLTAMTSVGSDCRLKFNDGAGTIETTTVQEVFPASTATTIASILYDSGATGLCSIVLATPLEEIRVNSMVSIAAAENVRVLSVTRGPDGTTSFRCSTTGTRAAGNAVQALVSVRVYLANTFAATNAVTSVNMTSAISTGTGILTGSIAVDLSLIATGVSSRPDDYIHTGILVDNQSNVAEGKILFDVDASTNDFTRNFYYYAFRANDLTSSVTGAKTLLTTKQTIIQRTQIDDAKYSQASESYQSAMSTNYSYNPAAFGASASSWSSRVSSVIAQPPTTQISQVEPIGSVQIQTGGSQWSELVFRISDLIRVGTDTSRTLKDVVKVRVTLTVTAATNLSVDDMWLGGGYGPDLGNVGLPYLYRYRGRVGSTGVKSNPSPTTRVGGGISPYRQSVVVSFTQHPSTECNLLDIERFGGTSLDWHYVGTIANSASPSFTDTLLDSAVNSNPSYTAPSFGFDNYQPWPIIDIPRTGTTASVAGTSVSSAAGFNTSWAPGTVINIAGVPYTIYRVVSTSLIEIVENAGSQGAVTWNVFEPLLLGQPLPTFWGPYEGSYFACGDTRNPGRLYFTTPNDPDSCRERPYIDITSGSEQLMNGDIYKGVAFVFSSEKQYIVRSDFASANLFRYEVVPNSRGMFSRWMLVVGPEIYFGGKDGIYATTLGEPVSLTDGDLYPLFPHEGNLGTLTNGFYPPNVVAAQAAFLRLSYCDDWLYFNYPDTNGGARVLAFNNSSIPEARGWWPDASATAMRYHYLDEGSGVHRILVAAGDGNFYSLSGTQDAGVAITCHTRTPSHDQGVPRNEKLYGDVLVKLQNITATATPYYNDSTIAGAAGSVSSVTLGPSVLELSGSWQSYRNLALDLTWTAAASQVIQFYTIRYTLETASLFAYSWETIIKTFDLPGWLHAHPVMYLAHVSTADLSLVFTIDDTAQAALTVTNGAGSHLKSKIVLPPAYKGKTWKLRVSSASQFRLDGANSEIRLKPWGGQAFTILRPFSQAGVQA